MNDFYSFFGISPSATQKEISGAFKKLALKYHPDKTGNRSTEEFQQLNEAYQILSNPAKKMDYDRVWYSKHSKKVPPAMISGVLASELIPDSHKYIEKRKKILITLRENPLLEKTSHNKKHKTTKIFDTIRARKDDVSAEKKDNVSSLSPITALEILVSFLKGEYWGVQLLYIKDYLVNSIAELTQNHYELPKLNLYHGVLGILNIVEDDSLRDNLYNYTKQIIDFAKQQAYFNDTRLLPLTTTLFQMKAFRELHLEGLYHYWQSPIELEVTSLFTSASDEKIEKGDPRFQTPKISQFYAAQCDFKETLDAKPLSPLHLHYLIYKVLDYIKASDLQNRVESLNNLLIAAKLYYVSSTLQEDEVEQMADEHMAVSLLLSACQEANGPIPFNTFYIYNVALHLMNNLNYVHPDSIQKIKRFEQHAVALADFFPCQDQLLSTIDLTMSQTQQMVLMQGYLSTLLDYFESDNSITIEVPLIPLVYFAYEALLGDWLYRENKKEKMMQLREWLMDNFLEEKEWSYRNISDYLLPETAALPRDEQGWMLPQAPLPFMKETTLYQSFNGFQVNVETATINFSMTPFDANSDSKSPLFTDLDVAEILNLAPSSIYFSLDPESADYLWHPFYKQIIRPDFLQIGQVINTIRDADLLLKFLVTGVEVRGFFPYDFRSINSLIDNLPSHLKKIITDYREQVLNKKGHVELFWFECQELPILHDEAHLKLAKTVSITFGTARFVLKSQKVKFDSSGNLQDLTQKEKSWSIYVMDSEQQAREQYRKQLLNAPAIIYCKTTNHFYFVRGLHFLAKPVSIELPSCYLEVLLKLPLNDNHQVIATGTTYEISSTHEFFYQFIKFVTNKAKEPHLFSAERVFAEEFTAHMTEFAEQFPIIARLEQLTRIIFVANQLKNLQKNNNSTIVDIENKLQEHYWTNEKKRLIELIKPKHHQFFSMLISSDSKEILDTASQMILEISNRVVISDEASLIAARQSLQTKFVHLSDCSETPNLEQSIEFLLNGNSEYLLKAEFNYQWQKQCKNIRAGLINHYPPEAVDALLNGNIEPIALFLATQEAEAIVAAAKLAFTEEKRNEFKLKLESCRIMARQYENFGLGRDNPETYPTTGCSWVPASHSHSDIADNLNLASGGVIIGGLPVLGSKAVYYRINAANQLTSNLMFPTCSVFTNWQDVKNAKQFLSDVNGTILNPDLMKAVSRLNVEVWHAEQELQRQQQERAIKNRPQDIKNSFFPEEKKDDTDRGFYHKTLDELPTIDILNGATGASGFNYRKSDSHLCTFWKSEYNNYAASQDIPKHTHVLSLFQRQSLLNKIIDGIKAECNGPTDEDKINEAKGEKYLHELTPKELIELSQMHMKDATRFFSNWYEKRRLKERPYPWYMHHKL